MKNTNELNITRLTLNEFLKAQWQLTPWVIIATIAFAIIYSNIKVGVYLGFVTLLGGNLTHLVYYLFIEDKKGKD